MPLKWSAEKIGEGYTEAKKGLIDFIRNRHGKESGSRIEGYIDEAENNIAQRLSTFAPTDKQEKALKLFEFIGAAKSANKLISHCNRKIWSTLKGGAYEFSHQELYVNHVGRHAFKEIIKEIGADQEISKIIGGKWGIGTHGTSQFLEHTIGHLDGKGGLNIKRMSALEESGGLSSGTLSSMYSGEAHKVIDALKNFDKLAEKVVSNPTKKVVLENGKKEAYWLQSIHKAGEGVACIKYDGKLQTMMDMKLRDFNRKFTDRNVG